MLPDHQQPLDWLCRINICIYSPIRSNFADNSIDNIPGICHTYCQIWLRMGWVYGWSGYFHKNMVPFSIWGCPTNILQWRYNGCDGVSNHRRPDCVLHRLFRCRSEKTSKLRVTGLCEGNSPVTGEFPLQKASNAGKCFHLMTTSW